VAPSFPTLHLWRDALAAYDPGLLAASLRSTRPGFEKYRVPLGGRFGAAPMPLAAVYVLEVDDDVPQPRIESVTGTAKARLLADQSYRPAYARAMGRADAHIRRVLQLAACVPLARLRRPSAGQPPERLAELLEADLLLPVTAEDRESAGELRNAQRQRRL
jgi:hypothetical protein